MDTRFLEAFVSAAECESFSRAATVLGTAQSILSRQIASLEHELGGRVFERTGRGVVLSEFGKTMLPRARALLMDVRRMHDEAAAQSGVAKGMVSIGVVPAWTQRVVGPLTRAVTQRHSEVALRVLEGYSGEIEKWVKNGEVDIGLRNIYREPTRNTQCLSKGDMFLVAPQGDPLRVHAELTFASLRGLDFAMQTRPNAFRSVLDEKCQGAGFSLSVKLESNSYIAIREAVTAGGLYGILPINVVHREVEAGTLHAIRIVEPALHQHTVLEATSFRPMTLASRSTLRIMTEIVRGIAKSGVAQTEHVQCGDTVHTDNPSGDLSGAPSTIPPG